MWIFLSPSSRKRFSNSRNRSFVQKNVSNWSNIWSFSYKKITSCCQMHIGNKAEAATKIFAWDGIWNFSISRKLFLRTWNFNTRKLKLRTEFSLVFPLNWQHVCFAVVGVVSLPVRALEDCLFRPIHNLMHKFSTTCFYMFFVSFYRRFHHFPEKVLNKVDIQEPIAPTVLFVTSSTPDDSQQYFQLKNGEFLNFLLLYGEIMWYNINDTFSSNVST